MRSIATISVAPDVNAWLAKTRHPRILHVFDHACNLINEQREVLSIVTGQIGNGPFNLVVEDRVLFSETLHRESPVSILNNRLIVGDLTFDTTSAECWSPRPDWERLHHNRDKISVQLAPFPCPDFQSPKLYTSNLASVLAGGDVSSSKIFTSQLAGKGVGLTPAGDDFIMGALYAAWIIHPFVDAKLLAMEVSKVAAPLTTSLSASWLRSAGRGESGEIWHEYFEGLIFSDRVQILSAVEKILSFGETSGAEALAGFIATIHSYTELKKNYVLPESI